jgi:hypothetical protein
MKKIHRQCTIPDGTPPHCVCGYEYPGECRGGHPIMPGSEWQRITGLAAGGVSFRQIADQTGHSLTTVRRVVHAS